MEKITITYDKVGNTLDVWFSKPRPCINKEIGKGQFGETVSTLENNGLAVFSMLYYD